jgi:hypothetical protein
MVFYASDCPGQLPVDLCCLSVAMLPRVFDLVFCKDIIQ